MDFEVMVDADTLRVDRGPSGRGWLGGCGDRQRRDQSLRRQETDILGDRPGAPARGEDTVRRHRTRQAGPGGGDPQHRPLDGVNRRGPAVRRLGKDAQGSRIQGHRGRGCRRYLRRIKGRGRRKGIRRLRFSVSRLENGIIRHIRDTRTWLNIVGGRREPEWIGTSSLRYDIVRTDSTFASWLFSFFRP